MDERVLVINFIGKYINFVSITFPNRYLIRYRYLMNNPIKTALEDSVPQPAIRTFNGPRNKWRYIVAKF